MCLTLLTTQPHDFTVSLFGEYLFPRLDETGEVAVREVYDVVVLPRKDLKSLSLLGVSPHNLITEEGRLRVETDCIPGTGESSDVAYMRPLGCGCGFDAEHNEFRATIRDTTRNFSPTEISIAAAVVTAAVRVPSAAASAHALTLLRQVGTVFEVSLPAMTAEVPVVMRLVVEPERLLGVQNRIPLKSQWGRKPTDWKQQLSIIGPRANNYNVKALLHGCEVWSGHKNSAAGILRLVSASQNEVLRAQVHRIVVILPAELRLQADSCFGCIWRTEAQTLPSGSQAIEWWSGTRHYWPDESRLVAERVWQQLIDWSKGNPKPVESVTTALGIRHENSALILDALCRAGGAEFVDAAKGLYAPVELSEEERAEVFDRVESDPQVREHFRWTGYQIEYAVEFFDAGKWTRLWLRYGPIILAVLAITGVILGLVSIVLAAG